MIVWAALLCMGGNDWAALLCMGGNDCLGCIIVYEW